MGGNLATLDREGQEAMVVGALVKVTAIRPQADKPVIQATPG